MIRIVPPALILLAAASFAPMAQAAKVTVDLGDAKGVKQVGAFQRWDQDGNATRRVNKDAKIDVPEVDASATHVGDGKWVFEDLEPGRYDVVIMTEGKRRIEGFDYPPVLEFDPFFAGDTTVPEDVEEFIFDDIKKSRHYENKVVPLYVGGDGEKVARVLVMLIRDLPTSYKPGAGTMRHEVWQYDWKYGGWVKNKRTRVLDRILMQVSGLRQWTWVWDPKLGGIEVDKEPITIEYDLPRPGDKRLKGLYPY